MRHFSVTTEQEIIFFPVFLLEKNMLNPRFCPSLKKKILCNREMLRTDGLVGIIEKKDRRREPL